VWIKSSILYVKKQNKEEQRGDSQILVPDKGNQTEKNIRGKSRKEEVEKYKVQLETSGKAWEAIQTKRPNKLRGSQIKNQGISVRGSSKKSID